jgi:hypothetical protein
MGAPLWNSMLDLIFVVRRHLKHLKFIGECLHNIVNTAQYKQIYTNVQTDLNMEGQLLMMKNNHLSL